MNTYREGTIGTAIFPEGKGQSKYKPYRVIVIDTKGTELLVRQYNGAKQKGLPWWIDEEIFNPENGAVDGHQVRSA